MSAVKSFVIKGDISGLTPEEREQHYQEVCDSLGISSATMPFAILKLNGKEVMYPTRGATDQLAAIHRLNRETIDGPKVIDVGGAKLVYAVCRATHPNGRTETAVGMVPLPAGAEAICNSFLKADTKSKRRATLSILGLGMLDESELDTIPARAKANAPPVVPVPNLDFHELRQATPLASPEASDMDEPFERIPELKKLEPIRTHPEVNLATATGKQLLEMAGNISSCDGFDGLVIRHYADRWAQLITEYDDQTLQIVLKKLETLPASIRENVDAWEPVITALEKRGVLPPEGAE